MTANALNRMINPQAAASPAAAAPAASANNQTTIPAPGTPATPLDGVNNQPAAAASSTTNTTTNTTTNPNYRTVTDSNGQTYLVGPNDQLYSPYTGNQTTTTSNQQQANYYPYMNNRGVYVGTGLDNVANWLIPNNQRERYRNIREQQGKGITDLTEEQIKAIQAGTANIAEITPEFRKTIFPWRKDNKLKSLNIKYRTPGQNATTTQTQAPMLMPGQKGYDPTVTNQTTTTTNQQQTTTQPGATAANPAASSSSATTSTKPGTTSTATTTSSGPSIDPNTGEYEMPSAIAARIEKEQKEAERKNLENYEKIKEMQVRQGKKPDAYDPNTNYDYGSKAASIQGTVDYTPPSQNAASNPSANAAVNTTTAGTTTTRRQAPSNANSSDAATAQKKASAIRRNQDYIDAQRAAASGQATTQSDASTNPNNYIQFYPEQYQERFSGSPIKTPVGPVENTYRLGGPYVLPMYEGLIGPSTTGNTTTGFKAPWQRTLDLIDEDNYKLNAEGKSEYVGPDEFEIGLDVGRTKKKGVNPYAAAMARGFADFINTSREDAAQDRNTAMMSAADKNFNVFDQDRGDYDQFGNFRLDQMVPHAQQGGPMMYDVADLFFLTPYMLKNTRGRR
jgi:hypothetical protein